MEGETRGIQIAIALMIMIGVFAFAFGFNAGRLRGRRESLTISEYTLSAKVTLPRENCSTCPQDDPSIRLELKPRNMQGETVKDSVIVFIALPAENFTLQHEYNDPLVKGLKLKYMRHIPLPNATTPET